MAEIVNFNGKTLKDTSCKDVIESVDADALENVLVIGLTKNNGFYFASSTGNKPMLLYLLDQFKSDLLNGEFD